MATLGVILVVVGAALMVAEAHLPSSHGVLGTGAAAALTAGVAATTRALERPARCKAPDAAT
jgi:membrane-bound ClpP family serine protease